MGQLFKRVGGTVTNSSLKAATKRRASKKLPEWEEIYKEVQQEIDPSLVNTQRPDAAGVKTVRPIAVPNLDTRHVKQGSAVRGHEKKNIPNLDYTIDRSGIYKPKVSLVDLEGEPYVSTMADQTNVGTITHIRGKELNEPIRLQGGQDFMFDPANPGKVWASDDGPSTWIMNMANDLKARTGKDPILMPWQMAPTGSHYATMLTETMIKYLRQQVSPEELKKFDEILKKAKKVENKKNKKTGEVTTKVTTLDNFVGLNHPNTIKQLSHLTGDQRKFLAAELDKIGTKAGGLSIPEARMIISDPKQLNMPDTSLHNVGRIHAGKSKTPSGHNTYQFDVPGEGIGELAEDARALEFLDPNKVVRDRTKDNPGQPLSGFWDPSKPSAPNVRALSGNTRMSTDIVDPARVLANRKQFTGGVITEKHLRALDDAGVFDFHGVTPEEQTAITKTLKGQRGRATVKELAAIGGLSATTIAALPVIFNQLNQKPVGDGTVLRDD